jgi:DNA-binding NarL/FixJ family response regulator
MTATKVVLVEDHGLVRAGLRALLEKFEDISVVGEASDGREAVQLVKRHRPHVVVMDVAMPNLNGIEAARQMIKESETVRILILSMHANEAYVLQTLRAGACGYMLKDAATTELELAIRAVARGETYLSPAVSKQVVRNLLQGDGGASQSEPLQLLTPRQREVLQLIAEGKNTKQIAYLLGTSSKTVETHRAHIMERLEIYDIVGLTRFAIRSGLVQLEEPLEEKLAPDKA